MQPLDEDGTKKKWNAAFVTVIVVLISVALWGAAQAAMMLRTVNWADLKLLLEGAAATFSRVNAALLISALWTVPVGVAIGFNPKLSRIVQPLAQVLASVPATAFFPILLMGLVRIGGGLGIGSIVLMLPGNAVVHFVQCDCGRDVDTFRFEGGRVALPIHALAAMDEIDFARNFSVFDYGHGDGFWRRLECFGLC